MAVKGKPKKKAHFVGSKLKRDELQAYVGCLRIIALQRRIEELEEELGHE